MDRVIGIRHRRKRTRDGEARPTMVCIDFGREVTSHELEDDTAELDFLMGRYPIEWRVVQPNEDVSNYRPHQCKWRKAGKDENVSALAAGHHRVIVDKKGIPVVEVLTKVPIAFEGLKKGDTVAMVLGGSGDRLAAALARRGEDIGAKVFRIPPFSLSDNRNGADKDNDHLTLISIMKARPNLFYQVRRRDRDLIRVKEALSARQDAMKDRIKCEQRIRQALVGKIFLTEEGGFPEGVIEEQFDKAKANDVILQSLIAEESRREKELTKAVKSVEVWERIFESIAGVGPRLAAGIIAPIGDIRRFMAPNGAARLKKFCGVHVMNDGRFPRRRGGEVANWSPLARQALYLLGDQFNRRPDSEWGRKLLHYKLTLREKHPDVVEIEGKKRYTNGHIHKMAQWRTLTRFVESLYRQWTAIENEKSTT